MIHTETGSIDQAKMVLVELTPEEADIIRSLRDDRDRNLDIYAHKVALVKTTSTAKQLARHSQALTVRLKK